MNEKPGFAPSGCDELLANPGSAGLVCHGLIISLFALVEAKLLLLPLREFSLLLLTGGLYLLVSGALEIRRQNGFGATAFCGYGFFWLSLLALFIYPRLGRGHDFHPSMLASYLIMWGLFTAILFLGTLRLSRTLRLAFVLLTVYQLTFAAALAMNLEGLQAAAGYLGAVCGLLFVVLGVVKLCSGSRSGEEVPACGSRLG